VLVDPSEAVWSSRCSSYLVDEFPGVSPIFVVIHDGAGGWARVDALEQEIWSEGGGFFVIPSIRRCDVVDLGPR
jgi:hypothetical protein